MSQMMTILATSLVATSLLTAAAEARGGGHIGHPCNGSKHCHASFYRIDRPSFDRSYLSDPDYYAACDEPWMPKAFWPKSCK
jgi:hypothetical protein